MKRLLPLFVLVLTAWCVAPATLAAEAGSNPTKVTVTEAAHGQTTATTVAAPSDGAGTTVTTVVAAPARPRSVVSEEATDLLERFVSWLHHFFPQIDDHLFHWIACGIIIVLAIVLRHVITNIIFFYLKKLAEKTETTLDDKLFPALEGPTAALVMVLGIYAALTVLQLSENGDAILNTCGKIAVLAVIIWGIIRAGGAVLDHAEEIAHSRQMTVATFMPLIKKTLLVFAIILGVLFIAESLGAKVGVLLGSLGIGGLALALAAQDMIANLFGSFVVVMDQPFRVGDTIKVGAFTGTVEDIGLRSTKVRLVDKSLAVIPNRSVASESITNLARFTQRRVEQVIGLTYDTTPEQMTEIVGEFKKIITAEADVDPASVMVFFRDYSASSLDIWVVYVTKTPDFQSAMRLRERLNLAMMRAVTARGLSFAFPTQTIQLDGPVARQLAAPRPVEQR
jgi:MscS family membrane protein